MFLRLKKNHTFIHPQNGVKRTALLDDFPICRISQLSLKSDDNGVVAEFFCLFFWDKETIEPFYIKNYYLLPEQTENYIILSIPEGTTELNLILVVQELVYSYLLSTNDFSDWDLIKNDN